MQTLHSESALNALIEAFQTLPGVGPKTAQRYAFHMVQAEEQTTQALVEALHEARTRIQACHHCHQWTSQPDGICHICEDEQRHTYSICVVQAPQDVYALERTRTHQGTYHVLGGLISPMDGVGPEQLHLKDLIDRFQALQGTRDVVLEAAGNKGMEAILALPPSTQGEMTGHFIARQLKPLGVTVSRIAYGLPMGGDLDYADQLTLTRALEGRQLI
jgi:recombination protein RecR